MHPFAFEPAFIRRRNERERQRVRCVNEGYARLREHLPIKDKEKRLSKVETLRGAIEYINYLQRLLATGKAASDSDDTDDGEDDDACKESRSLTSTPLSRDMKSDELDDDGSERN